MCTELASFPDLRASFHLANCTHRPKNEILWFENEATTPHQNFQLYSTTQSHSCTNGYLGIFSLLVNVNLNIFSSTANAELLKSLQDLEDTQKSYRERLTALCDQLQGAHGVVGGGIPHSAAGWMDVGSLPSAADWLAQLQQLESEKSHLLE